MTTDPVAVPEAPAFVIAVRAYLDARDHRAGLEKKIAPLRKLEQELEAAKADESARSPARADLLTAKSAQALNHALEGAGWLRTGAGAALPVSYVEITVRGGVARLTAVFSQPVYKGWRRDNPLGFCISPLRADAPNDLPDGCIPVFLDVLETELDVVCWDIADNQVRLWGRDGERGPVVIVLREAPAQ